MHRPTTTLTLSAGLALWATLACGSSSEPASGTQLEPVVCEVPGYPSEGEPVMVEQVKASVRLPSGEGLANLQVQVCGLDVCVPSKTEANGVVNVALRESILLPALKYGDGFDFAELAAPLGSEAKPDLGELVALPLPTLAEGAKFPKSGAVKSGDLTLQLAANGSFEHDILTYGDEAERVFRSVAIPVAESKQALPESFRFELAYGVAPLGTTFCPPAKISLKNTLDWSPGTEVEVFVQGLDVTEKWAPYATWLMVGEARVSNDGSSIDSTSGGITILSSIALRRK